MSADQRVEIARDYLQGARQRDVKHLPPSRLMIEAAETRHQLAQVLAAYTDLEQAATGYSLTPEQAGTVLAALGDAVIYCAGRGDTGAAAYRELIRVISGQLRRGAGGAR